MSHTAQMILDQLVLVKVDASIYGARKKLRKEDLLLVEGSQLPPEDLASLGSKRLLDPEQLAVFNRLKKEADRICLRVGTRFMGGYAIPTAAAPGILGELERIAQDFAVAKAAFLANYDVAIQDWVLRHPEFASIIEQAVDTVAFVATRFAFDYLLVTVSLPETLPPAEKVRLATKIGSLSSQMFYEIAVEANQFIEQSLLGKAQVTRSALRPIKRMRDKLDGLGFLDHRVAPLVNHIDQLLTRIPERGAIEGPLLGEILAMAMLLADSDKTQRHGAGLLLQQDRADVSTHNTETIQTLSEDSGSGHATDTDIATANATTTATAINLSDLFEGIFEEAQTEPAQASELERVDSNLMDRTDVQKIKPTIVADYWF